MLVPMGRMLQNARRESYAVGAFNVYNMETVRGVLRAAVEKDSPVILALAEVHFARTSPAEVSAIARSIGQNLGIPVALHLDHCFSVENVVKAIRSGFTSVMFDGSKLPYEENVAKTKEVVRMAHAVGVTVEAELGHVGSGDSYDSEGSDWSKWFTDPVAAREFVEETSVDCLAVAIGTAHGLYRGTPKLDLERLSAIATEVTVPLVLHGGSSTGARILQDAVSRGISKVNVHTDLVTAVEARLGLLTKCDTGKISSAECLSILEQEYARVAGDYMDVFGSSGKARTFRGAVSLFQA